jgi:hypothetical protein
VGAVESTGAGVQSTVHVAVVPVPEVHSTVADVSAGKVYTNVPGNALESTVFPVAPFTVSVIDVGEPVAGAPPVMVSCSPAKKWLERTPPVWLDESKLGFCTAAQPSDVWRGVHVTDQFTLPPGVANQKTEAVVLTGNVKDTVPGNGEESVVEALIRSSRPVGVPVSNGPVPWNVMRSPALKARLMGPPDP